MNLSSLSLKFTDFVRNKFRYGEMRLNAHTGFLPTLRVKVSKSKGVPRQAEVALRVPGRLRPRIFSTFGTTRVAVRQPKASAAFTLGEIPGTHFQRLSRPQGTWFCWKEPRKKSQVIPPGIDPGTVRLVAQRLNHYATYIESSFAKTYLYLQEPY